MKKILIFCFVAILAIFNFSITDANAQTSTAIKRRCAGSSPSVKESKIEVLPVGDVNIVPCSGRNFLVNGSPLPSLLTLNGTSRTGYLSLFDAESTLTKSFIQQTSTSINIFQPGVDAFSARFTRSGGASGIELKNAAGTQTFNLNSSGIQLTTTSFVVNGASNFADDLTLNGKLKFARTSGAECAGIVALSGGAAEVSTSCATENSQVFLSYSYPTESPGILSGSPSAGSVTVRSSNIADASNVYYLITN